MAQYQDFPVSLWEELIEYPLETQLLFIYFWTNSRCRPSGLYKIHPTYLENLLCGVDRPPGGRLQAAIKPLLGRLLEYDFDTHEVWVKDKAKHIRKLFDNEPMQISIQTDIKLLESEVLRGLFLGFYEKFLRPPTGRLSQSQRQSQKIGERERKDYVETPTREKSNQERWVYPPEVQDLVKKAIGRKKMA